MKRLFLWVMDSLFAILAIGLVAGVSLVFWLHYQESEEHAHEIAIEDARNFSGSVAQFRNFYAGTILPALKQYNVPVTHNYLKQPGSVPLPATFAIDFGDKLSANSQYKVRLYSDMPFTWRKDGGVRDDFERQAMNYLRDNPTESFSRYEIVNGQSVLRFAVADVMKATCVGCHNTYTGSPKTDWKEGDVRGVLEVIRPISAVQEHSKAAAWTTFLAMVGMAVLALLLLGVVVHRNKKAVAEAKLQQAKTQAIMDSVVDAIVVINENGVVLEVNKAITKILGYSAEDLVGNNISLITPEPHRSKHDEYLRRYLAEGEPRVIGFTRQLEAVNKEGQLVPIDLAVSEVWNGRERNFTGIIRDGRERRSAELAIEKSRDIALESVRMKSEFLANMSHEIRTPMNGVIGMTGLLLDTALSAEQRELSLTVESSAKSLLGIINDILDFSKIEAGKLDLSIEEVALVSLLDSIVDMVAPAAQAKGLNFAYFIDPQLPAHFNTDPVRLRQVLINLLGNSIKFTQQGSVYLNVIKAAEGSQKICFEVVDTGMGISLEGQSKLFGVFSQVDSSSSRQFGGTGLGLAISRQLVALLGGDIAVKSELGQGSCFIFRLNVMRLMSHRRALCLAYNRW
ncbi:PAS domain S-box protein [Thiomicrorhabdus aquaedulcis]|uniref:PAS domain S-box protein n=1 Tax=Thiomicrorhabdus aquaedulcis TaxID=2211106 RepID=UPI000FD7555B|nr:PAS domain S-box protein [Thiomicrorhabdus aquaedulcis]